MKKKKVMKSILIVLICLGVNAYVKGSAKDRIDKESDQVSIFDTRDLVTGK